MTKHELIKKLADSQDLSISQTRDIVDDLIEIVTAQVKKGEPVTITGFVKFTRKDIKARKAGKMISPFTKEEVEVKARPASKGVKITPLKAFKDAVASKKAR